MDMRNSCPRGYFHLLVATYSGERVSTHIGKDWATTNWTSIASRSIPKICTTPNAHCQRAKA